MGQRVDGDQGLSRPASTFLHRRPRLQLTLLLSGPVGWLVVAYLGSLAVLFVAAFWHLDSFTSAIVKDYSFQNFQTLVENDVYRQIALRAVGIAAVTVTPDALLAFPIAFYMAKVATPRVRADARGRDPDAAVGELPREVYVADDPVRGGDPQLGALAVRGQRARVRQRRDLARLQLPLAAVHDSAALRGHGADPQLAARRRRRPRRAARADLPARDPAAGAARARGRLDLHVLADARRLHHAAARVEHAVHRQRRLRECRRRQQPAARGGVRHGAGGDHDRCTS